jgi:hypothetical protein
MAKLGETVGSAGDGLVKIERVSDDLNLTIARVFGPGLEGQREQLVKLAQSYSNLTPSEREVRIKELIDKYKQLKDIDPVQLERSLASIAGMGTTVQGFLKGQAEALKDGLAKSHEVLDKLDGRKPTSLAEIEAVATEEVAHRFPEVVDIMRGNSKLVAQQQITILQMASQTFADLVRKMGGDDFLQEEGKQQAEVLIKKIKAISLTRNKDTAVVDVELAIQALAKENEKLGKNVVSRMQQIKEFLAAAADKLDPGANKSLLESGVKEISKEQEITGAKSVAEIDARVAVNNELFEPVRTNPDFRANLLNMPDTTVGREAALSYTAPGSQGIPMEDVLNGTQAYKDFLALATEFNDIHKRFEEIKKETTKEYNEGKARSNAVEAATTDYNDARVNKQFPQARAALDAKINAQKAVELKNLEDAERERVASLSSKDDDKNRSVIKKKLDVQARLNKLEIDRAKELEQINREEAKVNLKRTEGELQGREKRLLGVLDNATNLTPQKVIDDTVSELTEVRGALLTAFRGRTRLQGTENDLSAAEIAEREKALDKYQNQVGFLELIYRREKGAREDLASLLDITLTTGNPVRDAELEDKGLIPGDRGRRTDFLQNRMGILQELHRSSSHDLDKASADVTRLQAASDKDTGNQELSKSLRLAKEYERDLVHETANWNHELGQTGLALERVSGTWKSGFTKAFDPNVISRALEQSESSLEHFGEVINDHVVTALESVGDAFADAALEGESLSGSIEKVFT